MDQRIKKLEEQMSRWNKEEEKEKVNISPSRGVLKGISPIDPNSNADLNSQTPEGGYGRGKGRGRGRGRGWGASEPKLDDVCAWCYGQGHWWRQCPSKPPVFGFGNPQCPVLSPQQQFAQQQAQFHQQPVYQQPMPQYQRQQMSQTPQTSPVPQGPPVPHANAYGGTPPVANIQMNQNEQTQ